MKKLVISLFLIISIQSFGQCTFERINQNYFIDVNRYRTISQYDENIGFVTITLALKDTSFFPNGIPILLISQTDTCGYLKWSRVDDEVMVGTDFANLRNNIIKDNNSNYYIVSIDGGRIQSLVTKYDINGKKISRKYLNDNSLPIKYANDIRTYGLEDNKFILFGLTQPALIWPDKPLLVLIDKDLNALKEVIYDYAEYSKIPSANTGRIEDLFVASNKILYAYFFASNTNIGSDSLYLVKIDSNLKIVKSISLQNNLITKYGAYFTNFDKEKNEFTCYGDIELAIDNFSKLAFWRADTNGKILYLKKFPLGGYPLPTCMSSTRDGGVICGPGLLKLDSNFNVQWYKPTKGALTSITQLPDGGYVGSGVSNALTTTWGDTNEVRYYQPYLIRTDKNGNYAPLLLPESAHQQLNTNISIYPNPAQNTLTIAGAENANFTITDIMGRVVDKRTLKTNTISIEHIPNGMYIVTLTLANGNVYSQKIAVQHE